jgi:hypothetical protein
MKITKSELKEMIREALREELESKKIKLKESTANKYLVTYRLSCWDAAEPNDEVEVSASSESEAIEATYEWLLDTEGLEDEDPLDLIMQDDIKIINVKPI